MISDALLRNSDAILQDDSGLPFKKFAPEQWKTQLYGDYNQPYGSFRWMGSTAMDRNGDMALGFSLSSASQHPGIAYTGRLAGDPAGTMPQGEMNVITGGGSQFGSNGANRWGDYSEMTVDPADDCTF